MYDPSPKLYSESKNKKIREEGENAEWEDRDRPNLAYIWCAAAARHTDWESDKKPSSKTQGFPTYVGRLKKEKQDSYTIQEAQLPQRSKIDRKSAISLQRGQFNPKFQVEGIAPTNHSSSEKARLNDLSYGIKIWTNISSASVLSQCTRLTNRRTNRENSHR